MQTFVSTFEEYSDIFCDTLKKELNNGEFDLLPYIKKNTFDILCSTTFGTDMKDFSKKPLYDKVFKAYKM